MMTQAARVVCSAPTKHRYLDTASTDLVDQTCHTSPGKYCRFYVQQITLKEGVVLKHAQVQPRFKKSSLYLDDLNSYRPI